MQNSDKAIGELLAYYHEYAQIRKRLLTRIKIPSSCRDPLAEFSEVFVATLLGARMADSRVQKGFDLIKQNGRRVQVKYLCNPDQNWINEHTIRFVKEVEDYALVIFEGLQLKSVLIFPKKDTSKVAKLLKKRHANQDKSIQLTHRNYLTILERRSEFAALGVEIFQYY